MTNPLEREGSARSPFFETEQREHPCWQCDSVLELPHRCGQCASIQHFLEETNYFSYFNLGYELAIDLEKLEEKYHDLSRCFHPDFFLQRSEKEQEISLKNTALLNEAYRTLKDPTSRAAYLISLIEGDQPLPTEAPTALFEEVFEAQEAMESINGALDGNATVPPDALSLLLEIEEKMKHFEEAGEGELRDCFSAWDKLESLSPSEVLKARISTPDQQGIVSEIKQILSHRAYLDRVLGKIFTTLKRTA